MQTYVFYVKEKNVRIIPKNELTDLERSRLTSNGFKKYHLEVEANDKKDAARKLNDINNENLNALSEFTGSHLFTAAFIVGALILAYFYL
ncbi:TPA: hypothetical protein ACG1QB_004261 [Enterobacter asburiae]|uniref:hypothetical protein n=1 Tax=Enterobacter asburiae TaxID=61645 RepID=UPI002967296A|nr:hypothetical protein [Enterobacter asburiae]MDW3573232.1 DUF505 domain-containing protein [Enterobacter asburiae]